MHHITLLKSYTLMEENHTETQYPPGIRFHPSDEELISYYLERKVKSLPLPENVITDIELYRYNPWDLPRRTLFGEEEWYFFTPRHKKYPNGGRPNRTTASGYWKATGTDKPIISSCGSRKIGVKKGLVFYKGKPPCGVKMDWIMTEYRLPDTSRPLRSKGSMRLDDWVLCRIQQKGNMSKNEHENDQNSSEFRESNTKELFSDSRDKLADYLQSSEHHLLVSLLVGCEPGAINIPKTTFQSSNSGNSSTKISESWSGEMNIEMINEEANFDLFQSSPDSVLCDPNSYKNIELPTNTTLNEQKDGQSGSTMGAKSYYQHTFEGYKCKEPDFYNNTTSFLDY